MNEVALFGVMPFLGFISTMKWLFWVLCHSWGLYRLLVLICLCIREASVYSDECFVYHVCVLKRLVKFVGTLVTCVCINHLEFQRFLMGIEPVMEKYSINILEITRNQDGINKDSLKHEKYIKSFGHMSTPSK